MKRLVETKIQPSMILKNYKIVISHGKSTVKWNLLYCNLTSRKK